MTGLSTIGNTKVLAARLLLRFTPFLIVEADGRSSEYAPALSGAPRAGVSAGGGGAVDANRGAGRG